MLHSYFVYPFTLWLLSVFFKPNQVIYTSPDELPMVSVLLSVYNEEQIIRKKIQSIFETNYPIEKIELLIGSDASNDYTNDIILSLKKDYPNLKFHPFNSRQGKIKTMNMLVKYSLGEILIFTDAKAIFTNNTIFHLVKHFRNRRISIVGASIMSRLKKKSGSGIQETSYMNYENHIKYFEGKIFKKVIGVFGACFAIRREAFSPVPENYLVDDLYTTLHALQQKKWVIYEKHAIVHENVTEHMNEEYRRKKRIATGNIQNLSHFLHLLSPAYGSTSYAFLSHKVLRWFGPFIMMDLFWSNLILAFNDNLYKSIFIVQIILYTIPFIDYLLRKIQLHIIILRFITHFMNMNLALFVGFLNYLKGVNTNVWEPTKRDE